MLLPTKSIRESTTPERIRLGILIGLSAISIAAFIIYLLLALHWRSNPFMGVLLSHNLTVNAARPAGSESWPGLDAGLLPGDQLISINGQTLTIGGGFAASSEAYLRIIGELSIGDRISITFRRPISKLNQAADRVVCQVPTEDFATCEVSFTLDRFTTSDFLAFFGVPFGSGLIVLAIALALLRSRPWEPQAFTAICGSLLLANFMVGIFDTGTTHVLFPFWLTNGVLLGGIMITIGLIFPTPISAVYRWPWMRFVPIAFSGIVALYVLGTFGDESPQQLSESAQIAGVSAIMGMAILAAVLFFYQRPRAVSQTARFQANILFMGIVFALAPAAFWLVSQIIQLVIGESLLPFSIETSMPFFITPAIAMAYAILQFQSFDTDRYISQGITYSLMFIALVIGYFLLVLGASLFTTDAIEANDPLAIVLTIFFISALFVPLRTRIQRRIDEIYFRLRRDYQNKLEEFSRKLTSLAGSDVMIREFRVLINDTLQPINNLLFLYNRQSDNYVAYGEPSPETDVVFAKDSGVVQLLKNRDTTIYLPPGSPLPAELHIDRARLGIIKVMVIAGMAGSNQLNGFVAMGPPRSGANAYNYEELRFINNLVGQLAIAVERAQVIQSLERRVRELDVLSQVSQAVNFTIEFDDLLELISAQTLRLIQSPYFYIALHDPVNDLLYFAFFLEDDERDSDKENRKWPVGRDFFSEVIRTSQPRIVNDYMRAMEQHQYQRVYESPDTRAWMGVPLIAGPRTLGVLAIATSDPSEKYTQEQARIFGNIGALAATSIEKARLFSETNIRARQLEALNDINRQLVATEGDVEKLLDLITSSAVDILNAEAGSLLLVAEDGSGDLIFKAAVGGTGHLLIGTRLPAGRGVVGKVGLSGEPIISNDTSRDERWEGEVVKEFRTQSVLAVPLIAKESVVGVLEVINKVDGSVFVEEDVELLTTFAGQAAIAYENARLLQQTDIELTKRVKELEALELIDKELNKNLDLDNVAKITIRWAIANSGATSGLLGVVSEDRAHLHIIAKYGYKDDDHPEGAEADQWPLDRGIVKRVMRTRRPELQPDVSIDPDYVPSLRGSLSQITVPMLSGDEINAILVLETSREPRLNLLDLDWVQRLAEHASIAIANAQLYAELTRANETKSEFVGFAAHELKNPLSSVKGYADLLRSGMSGEVSTQQRDFLGIIRANADRMQTIIDDLRDIARIDAGQLKIVPAPIDFRTVVTDTLQTYQRNLEEKRQTLINNVPENLPLIMADRMRLIQVMTNLISNANKYSPPESTITIGAAVENHHRDERNRPIGPALHVYVRDTGIGMNEEDLQKIFRVRYFRSDNQKAKDQPGTGLGMMITQNLIRQHRGIIWVESKLGEGSTFNFVIPLAPEVEPETQAEAETELASD